MQMAGHVQDDVETAAGAIRRQIADFDDALPVDLDTGPLADNALDRRIEITFEKQRFTVGAAPSCRSDDPLVFFDQHQIGRKGFDIGPIAFMEDVSDKVFRFGTTGRIQVEMRRTDG